MKTFMFMGPSGCGKGTQAKLLQDKLQTIDPETPIFHMQTGQYFREFIKGDSYAARTAHEIVTSGGRPPDFLAIWIWCDVFIKNLTGREHILIDGFPRSLNEARNLNTALKFFKRDRPIMFFMNVSPEWSTLRLVERARKEGRADDSREGIEKRLAWYTEDVLPAVEFYRNNPDYTFVELNGERPINEIHEEIMRHLA